MPDQERPDIERLRLQARMPRFVRVGAATLLVLAVMGLIIAFFVTERPSEFRMKNFPATLSKDVVAVVEGYERRESDGSRTRYYVKADRATTFSDNHQELENVYLEVYDDEGVTFDRMTSKKAVYIPEGTRDFKVFFAGDVDILTRDGLKVKTDQLSYDKVSETAEAEELVEFEREEVRGSSVGARVKMKEQKLELLSKVSMSGYARSQGDLTKNKIESFKAGGGWAEIDQVGGTIKFERDVRISIDPMAENPSSDSPASFKAQSAAAYLENREVSKIELVGNVEIEQSATAKSPRWTKTSSDRATAVIVDDLKSFELTGNARITTAEGKSAPTVINAGYAAYDREKDSFGLRQAVSIVTEETPQSATFKAEAADYSQRTGKVDMSGGVELKTFAETLTASTASAQLNEARKVTKATAKGDARLVQNSPERTSEIKAAELVTVFDQNQQLQTADARTDASFTMVPVNQDQFSVAKLAAPRNIRAVFAGEGRFQTVETEGRTTVYMAPPSSAADPADKELTADAVKVLFAPEGRSLARAEAIGRAEVVVRPRTSGDQDFVTTVTAPRFDCEFLPGDNNLRQCQSGGRTRTVRQPMKPITGRGDQVLESDRVTADFSAVNRNLDKLEAIGNARFSELDRSGSANNALFTASTGIVALRGGQPSVWDSKARARATEIDIHTNSDLVKLEGAVSATYFNQRRSGQFVTISSSAGPVYITSDSGEFLEDGQVGTFTGSARAWQGDNFIRADRIEVFGQKRLMVADGRASSMVFNVRPGSDASTAGMPAFGSAGRISYDSAKSVVTYEGDVELKQGTDVIRAQKVVAELNERNELVRASAQTGVGLFQPGRRASGDFAQYNVVQDSVVLRGDPATIIDEENGSTEGGEVTVFLRERRIAGDGRTKPGSSGRIRTVYKVKNKR